MENYSSEREKATVNSDAFAGWWKQMRGSARSWWGKLTDDDIEYVAGQKDKLVGVLQKKYGYARERAQEEIDQHMREARSQASNTVDNVKNTIGETANYASQRAAEIGHTISSTAQDLGETTAGQAKAAAVTVGEQMESLAGNIRENAPQSGMIATAANTVADQMESAGLYLQKNDFANITHDLSTLVRRYPIHSMLLGVGLGYLLARRGER